MSTAHFPANDLVQIRVTLRPDFDRLPLPEQADPVCAMGSQRLYKETWCVDKKLRIVFIHWTTARARAEHRSAP